MSKNSKEYKTPEEKTKDLLEDIESTLDLGKSDITWQNLTESWRTNQQDFNDSKSKKR